MSLQIPSDINTTSNLAVGTSTFGSLDFLGDKDWWRVSLATGYGYEFWLEGSSACAGTLFDPYLSSEVTPQIQY
jgi:hypothetical protein